MKLIEFDLTPEQIVKLAPLFDEMARDYLKNPLGSIVFQVYENKPAKGCYVPYKQARKMTDVLKGE